MKDKNLVNLSIPIVLSTAIEVRMSDEYGRKCTLLFYDVLLLLGCDLMLLHPDSVLSRTYNGVAMWQPSHIPYMLLRNCKLKINAP